MLDNLELLWVDWVLVGVSTASVIIMLERAWFFWVRRGDALALTREVSACLDRGARDEAVWRLGSSKTMAATVGLQVAKATTPPDGLEDVYKGELETVRLQYERGLSMLASIGANAPFLGLLGTVIGIIAAFHTLSGLDPGADRAAVVMNSIGSALRSTALGIIVALPAVVSYNAFQRRIDVAVGRTETLVRAILARRRADP